MIWRNRLKMHFKRNYRMLKHNHKVLRGKYYDALKNHIRDKDSSADMLRKTLYTAGQCLGQSIVSNHYMVQKTITTPMEVQLSGAFFNNKKTLVLSTKDDYAYFGKGLIDSLPNAISGYMDFNGARGLDALKQPIRSMFFPEDKDVDSVIIAKSVLATGCTALSLLNKAIEIYHPTTIIVTSIFYTKTGVEELCQKNPHVKLYLLGKPDSINSDGMLIPGVGNLDNRLK